MKGVKAAHVDLGKCTTGNHHGRSGKKKERDRRAGPNSMDSEQRFSRGEQKGERKKVGTCHGWRFGGVSLSRGLSLRSREQR